MNRTGLHRAFEVHRLNIDGITKAGRVRVILDRALTDIRDIAPEEGGSSLLTSSGDTVRRAIDHMELAGFLFVKAISQRPQNWQDMPMPAESGGPAPSRLDEMADSFIGRAEASPDDQRRLLELRGKLLEELRVTEGKLLKF